MFEGHLTCNCGCGQEITWKPHYKYRGVPDYIHGHNWVGKSLSEETKNKISQFHLGRRASAQTKVRLSEFHKGKHLSEEAKEKLRAYYQTSDRAREIVQGMIDSNRGRPLPKDHRRKIALANTGRHPTEETRKKMRLSAMNKERMPFMNTKIEIEMQDRLDKLGVTFETQKRIFGRPDIFIEPNICVFCDGDYWHNLERQKIRDELVNSKLASQGYKIFRFWEHDIKSHPLRCAKEVYRCL